MIYFIILSTLCFVVYAVMTTSLRLKTKKQIEDSLKAFEEWDATNNVILKKSYNNIYKNFIREYKYAPDQILTLEKLFNNPEIDPIARKYQEYMPYRNQFIGETSSLLISNFRKPYYLVEKDGSNELKKLLAMYVTTFYSPPEPLWELVRKDINFYIRVLMDDNFKNSLLDGSCEIPKERKEDLLNYGKEVSMFLGYAANRNSPMGIDPVPILAEIWDILDLKIACYYFNKDYIRFEDIINFNRTIIFLKNIANVSSKVARTYIYDELKESSRQLKSNGKETLLSYDEMLESLN